MSTPCFGPQARLWDDQLDLPDTHKGEPPTSRAARHAEAAATCLSSCPRLVRCLSDRLSDPAKPGGVYGGQVFAEGAANPMAPAARPTHPIPGVTHCANPDCDNALTGPQRNHGTATCSPACRAASTPTGREVTAA